MKKILALSIAVVLVIGLVAGGTWAYFSDTETSTGNSLTAGIIDIELSHLDANGAVIDIDDIKPCQVKYGFFDIHGAEGTNPGYVYIHFTDVQTGQGEPSLSAELAAEASNGIWHNIDDWMTISLHVVTERPDSVADINEAWITAHLVETVIDHDDHMKLGDLESAIIPVGYIEGYSDRIWLVMDVHLQAETPNDYQGDTCTFTVEAIMTQEGAPPPLQSGNKIILENKDASWNPILGDGIWGIVQYNTSTLTLDIHCQGLPTNTAMQVCLNSPEFNTSYFPGITQTIYEQLASALASGVYSSPPSTNATWGVNYVRGYWPGNDSSTTDAGNYVNDDVGIYNIAQGAGHISDYGGYAAAPQTTSTGVLDCTISTSGLPSGDYMYIKVLIKLDASPWTVYLMEKSFGLFFTIS